MSNRLSMERSPYLLQHADNPVDWRPWGPEAFEEAKRADKPVFLSIGYSTCHWCHVMAHESFEDEAVARTVNREFLPVKVDREERPDVDAVYMAACVAMNGSGGWPLTVLLTPDQKPFWAGTYLPKAQLLHLLHGAARLWREDRAGVLSAGEALTAHLRQETENRAGAPSREVVRQAAGQFTQSYDRRWGGFGPAPKFPTPHNLIFLLRYARLTGEEGARRMALHTLDSMYRGGLFDHVGGGFSRYSTDGRWLIPHFEKMLYDNALLALVCTEAFQHTRRPIYGEIVRRTLDYVLRELSGPALGKPPKDSVLSRQEKKREYQDSCGRNAVDGIFDTAKTAYGLGCVMARLQETAVCVISVALLLLNLSRSLRAALALFCFLSVAAISPGLRSRA